MIKTILRRMLWLGRGTATMMGVAVLLAVVLGIATTALAAMPGDSFKLGKNNAINKLSTLVGSVNNAMLRIDNDNAGANATALDLQVEPGKAPMKVDSQAEVGNLNAQFAGTADNAVHAAQADSAANADRLGGKDIDELPGSVVQAVNVTGEGSAVPFGSFSFVAPLVTVTTSSSTQRLVGVISAPLKLDSGGPLTFNYGLCYRAANTNNALANFSGANHPQGMATTTPVSWTAAATTVPGVAGTWEVGFCAANASDQFVTLRGAGRVSGWIEVVNPTP